MRNIITFVPLAILHCTEKPTVLQLSFKKYLAIMIPCLTIGPKIRMANMMEKIMADLEVITDQHKKFESAKDTTAKEPKVTDIRETVSFMDTQIVGRTTEEEEILASLSQSMQNDITILPIYGIGGLGKTTLATMVYNSSQFKEFSRVWVYVSQTFDLMNIGNSIISQLTKEKKESEYTIMQLMQNSLQELLADKNKKILIVLDDLWEADVFRLKSLKDMLKIGNGSNVIVIVTTRDEDIANKISTIQPYKLRPLTDDMCWSIIKEKSAFESRGDREQLEKIGNVIAMKCCGVALAANSLGHTLKSMKHSEWESVRDSNLWNVSSSVDTPYSQVLASLKLSYSVIPSYLKICFAYCAIFPKGHKIVKDNLIAQWVSLGFCTWQLGEKYISQLLGLSFLEYPKSSSVSLCTPYVIGQFYYLISLNWLAHTNTHIYKVHMLQGIYTRLQHPASPYNLAHKIPDSHWLAYINALVGIYCGGASTFINSIIPRHSS